MGHFQLPRRSRAFNASTLATLLTISLAACASSVSSGGDGGPDGSTQRVDSGTGHSPDVMALPDGRIPVGEIWDGYIESFTFPSGSDHVRIMFDPASGDGPRTGTVVFGMGTPPPPATDPTVGYPPGLDPMRASVNLVVEGFAYPIATASVTGARVQATVNLSAVWEGWCALQTPIAQDPSGGSYGCMPNTGFGSGPGGCTIPDPMTGMQVAVDCGRLFLCEMSRVCDCDATRCQAGRVGVAAFDFHVTGNNGDGTLNLASQNNVHLTR